MKRAPLGLLRPDMIDEDPLQLAGTDSNFSPGGRDSTTSGSNCNKAVELKFSISKILGIGKGEIYFTVVELFILFHV